MQLRYETGLTGEEYVSAEAWRDARLERCPNHPHGGCSFARHGTYARKTPRGTQIARWYCRDSHTTFSLLPDCLAARLPGELDHVETVVAHAEQAPSLAAVADELRRDAVELPGGLGEGVVRRPEDGDEDLCFAQLPGGALDDGHALSGVVDEQLFAGAVRLAHHHVEALTPSAVALAELTVLQPLSSAIGRAP